jgi:hypothetical protein
MLKPSASHPTKMDDGTPLVEGATYYNTADNILLSYNGSKWCSQTKYGLKAGVPTKADFDKYCYKFIRDTTDDYTCYYLVGSTVKKCKQPTTSCYKAKVLWKNAIGNQKSVTRTCQNIATFNVADGTALGGGGDEVNFTVDTAGEYKLSYKIAHTSGVTGCTSELGWKSKKITVTTPNTTQKVTLIPSTLNPSTGCNYYVEKIKVEYYL